MTFVSKRVEARTFEDMAGVARGNEDWRRTPSFDPIIKAAHWLTLLLIIMVFATAALLDDVSGPSRAFVLQLHRSLGVTIWLVTVLRLSWRQFARLPDWPADMPQWARRAAHATEYLLYGLLLVQPILGLLHTHAHGRPVMVFSLLRLPPLIEPDHELAERLLAAHGLIANLLLIVIALHAAAALFHHFIRRDETLLRMLPARGKAKRLCDFGNDVQVQTKAALEKTNRTAESQVRP